MNSIEEKSILLSSILFGSIFIFSISLVEINNILEKSNGHLFSYNKIHLMPMLIFNTSILFGSGFTFYYFATKNN